MPTLDLHEFPPDNASADYVEVFWHSTIEHPGELLLIPTANSELMAFRFAYKSGFAFIGPMSTAQRTPAKRGDICVGARLKPGVRPVFQGIDLKEFADTRILHDAMHDDAVASFVDQMDKNPADILEQLKKVTEHLIARNYLQKDKIIDLFIDYVMAAGAEVNIENITKNIPISERHLRRKAIKYLGMSPKEFVTINRQKLAIKDFQETKTTITQLAASHGYSDQAHFTKDFRRLIGITPISLGDELSIKQ